QRPCTESKLSRWAWVAASPAGSLICTNSSSGQPQAARRARRPMRPKPLMPTLMVMRKSSNRSMSVSVELLKPGHVGRMLDGLGPQGLDPGDGLGARQAAVDQDARGDQPGAP